MPVTYKDVGRDHLITLSATVIFKNALFKTDIKISPFEMDVLNPEINELEHFIIDQIKLTNEEVLLEDLNIPVDPSPMEFWEAPGELYDNEIEINKQNSLVWYNKELINYFCKYNEGLSLFKLGKYNEALQAYDEAFKSDSYNSNSWICKSLSLYFLNRINEAIAGYEKAIEINPQNSMVWYSEALSKSFIERIEGFYKEDEDFYKYDGEDLSKYL